MRIPFAIPSVVERPFDLVGFGQNSIDYVARSPIYPARNSKLKLDAFSLQAGGQVATALVACARLGWRTRYIGTFGDDHAGGLSRKSLVDEGVDVSAARTIPGAQNRVAVVLVDAPSGQRTVLWHRDPRLTFEELPLDAVVSGRLLLVDAEDLDRAALAAEAARRAGIPTLVDVDDVQPSTSGLLRHIDAIIAAEDFPSALTGHPQLGRALQMIDDEYHPALVCVTLGEHGSLARSGGREIRTPATSVHCLDTTGAGDVFRGAFAAGCLRWPDGELEHVLAYANLAAGLSCRALGARGSLPEPGELDRLLASES